MGPRRSFRPHHRRNGSTARGLAGHRRHGHTRLCELDKSRSHPRTLTLAAHGSRRGRVSPKEHAMPYCEGRIVHDADSHIFEPPGTAERFADPGIRDRLGDALRKLAWSTEVEAAVARQ